MSAMSEMTREKARMKAERLVRSSPGPVDASGWREPLGEKGNVQTGPRVLSRDNYRHGGKVAGLAGAHHAGRKPRKTDGRAFGGSTTTDDKWSSSMNPSKPAKALAESAMRMTSKRGTDPYDSQPSQASNYRKLWSLKGGRPERASGGRAFADALVNRDVKEANQDRHGEKHDGGFARGGHADAAQDRKLIHSMGCQCSKCSGGRVERKSGGGNWIAGAVKHPGALHKELHVPQGEKIPAKKLNAAAAKGGKEGERARLAKTLKGLPHKAAGGSLDGSIQGMRPQSGRMARKGGGRTKKGTNINIVIAPQSPRPAMPPPGVLPPPGGGPLGLHQGAPPPMPPPGAPPPAGPAMMSRARGGRTSEMLAKPGRYPLRDGSGGGLGRLEKVKGYGKNA